MSITGELHWAHRFSQVLDEAKITPYSVDVTDSAKARFADEMSDLAKAFNVMIVKVGERERSLKRTVAVLRVEIDEAKRKDSVNEIVDSDFFNDLSKKATAMRAKVKDLELADSIVGGGDEVGGASE